MTNIASQESTQAGLRWLTILKKRENYRKTMSEMVEEALRTILEPRQPATELPLLPEFRSGGLRINVANRDALYDVMGDYKISPRSRGKRGCHPFAC